MPQISTAFQRNRKLEIKSDCLLLVEGQDEVYFFNRMIQRCLDDESIIQVIEAGGIRKFPARLEAIIKRSKTRATLRSIGVVRDADNNPRGAFDSVCQHLRLSGYEPPNGHGEFSTATPSVGVFIVPDGHKTGALEALCRRSVENSDAAQCVEDYLECLDRQNAMQSGNRDKSFAHAYLAAMRDPVARVGEGALKNYWDFDSPSFQDLKSFVHELSDQGEQKRG